MDDFDTGMSLFRLAGPVMAIVTTLITLTIFVPIVLYVIARWRASKDPNPDRHLGLKVALHYFSISAFQLALAGLTLLVWALITSAPSEIKSVFNRIALGMLMPAVLIQVTHISLLRRTNDKQVTGVRRLFLGYNLIVTGLLGFIALVIAFQALLAKGSSGELGRAAGAMVLVYGTAWAVVGWRFGQLVVMGGDGGTGSISAPPASPAAVTPPAAPAALSGASSSSGASPYAPPSTPASTATPASGLPALGGGAFPPIEPKS